MGIGREGGIESEGEKGKEKRQINGETIINIYIQGR